MVEHQSRSDPLMAFRMLLYVARIWERHLKEHPNAKRLPAVIPVVLHHGRQPWTAPTEVRDLLDLDDDAIVAAGGHLPRFRFVLDDLARIEPAVLRARPLTPPARITLLLLKIATGNPNLAEDLRQWTDELEVMLRQPGGTQTLITVLTYIHYAGEAPSGALRDLFDQLGPRAREAYMTTADLLRAEGRAEGEARGMATVLVQLLTLKFGRLSEADLHRIQAADATRLQVWSARVLTADSIDDVLA